MNSQPATEANETHETAVSVQHCAANYQRDQGKHHKSAGHAVEIEPVSGRGLPKTGIFQMSAGDYRLFRSENAQDRSPEAGG
jgi:hypothetical protein